MDLDVIQIEPVRIGIEFEMAAALAGGRDHGFHINVVSIALADQPSCRMGNDGHVAIVHRGDDAFGLSLAREVEFIVDGGDDQIEAGENPVWQIEAAISENVDFRSLENRKPSSFSFSRSI